MASVAAARGGDSTDAKYTFAGDSSVAVADEVCSGPLPWDGDDRGGSEPRRCGVVIQKMIDKKIKCWVEVSQKMIASPARTFFINEGKA